MFHKIVLQEFMHKYLTFTLCRCSSWLLCLFSNSTFLVRRSLISDDVFSATTFTSSSSSSLKLSNIRSSASFYNRQKSCCQKTYPITTKALFYLPVLQVKWENLYWRWCRLRIRTFHFQILISVLVVLHHIGRPYRRTTICWDGVGIEPFPYRNL